MCNSKPQGYSDEEEYKTVLGVFKERRPIRYKCNTNEKEWYKNLLQAVKSCFEEVTALIEGASLTRDYYLQKESKE